MTMIKIFSFGVCLSLVLTSCVKTIYDHGYSGQSNYEEAYLVDTIVIANPIRVSVTEKELTTYFYISKDDLSEMINFDVQGFVASPKSYLYSDNPYNYIPPKLFPGFKQCIFSDWKMLNDKISISEPVDAEKFLLVMCSVNKYNQKEGHSDFKRIESKSYLSLYLKVVYPICE